MKDIYAVRYELFGVSHLFFLSFCCIYLYETKYIENTHTHKSKYYFKVRNLRMVVVVDK